MGSPDHGKQTTRIGRTLAIHVGAAAMNRYMLGFAMVGGLTGFFLAHWNCQSYTAI